MRRKYKRKKGVKTSRGNKKIYDGIEFASGLEIYCYKELKKTDLDFKYEEISYTLVDPITRGFEVYKKTKTKPYSSVKTKNVLKISYKPDFFIYDKGKLVYIIETKGHANESFPIRVKLFYNYAIRRLKYLKAYFLPSNQKEVDETIKLIQDEKSTRR